MKGQRQLVWGRGLKKLLRIDEKTDEEHAEETEKMQLNSLLLLIMDLLF